MMNSEEEKSSNFLFPSPENFMGQKSVYLGC